MKLSKTRFWSTIGILTLLISSIHTTASADDLVQSDWDDRGVQTDVWQPSPDGEYFDQAPSTGPEDPYIYEAKVACTSGDSIIFPECASVMPPCAAEQDGVESTAVYWYHALRNATPPVWVFDSGPVCVTGPSPRALLAEIAGQIAHEFQRTPVVAAEFGSQPGPHTLRGKETNVWATATTQTFNLTMLGQNVTITATPVAYTWNYGDGTIWGPTPIHGAPLHQDRIGEQTQTSHIYTETGRLTIGVTTHFDGTYTVNGGPELPIPGQGNIPSPAQPLTVWRAETHLYADDCIVNPNGIGC